MYRLLNAFHHLAIVVAVFSCTLWFPYALSWYVDDGAGSHFLWSALSALAVALLVWLVTRPFKRSLQLRDGILLVFMAWLALATVGSLPIYFSLKEIDDGHRFAMAFFEGMSGLTTTGASVISDVQALPLSINVWRHALLWFGGMGILLLAVAILPLFNVGGRELLQNEMPGPLKDEKLTPRIASTAKALYGIYFVVSLLCVVAYRVAGLSWFDAWCHAASTMALGGFSSITNGFVAIDNVAVEVVAIVFMLFSGINYATHFKVFSHRDPRLYRDCPEALPFLKLLLGSGLLVSTFLLISGQYDNWFDALRYGLFNTVSVATTTGFANDDYLLWPYVIPVMLLVLGTFATSGGSTGGGIKLIRLLVVLRQVRIEMLRLLHPHGIFHLRFKTATVSERVLISVLMFLMLYAATAVVVFLLLLISGVEPITAFGAAVACLANIGPGLGDVGPLGSYVHFSDLQLWICSSAMLIGRLEIMTVFVIFTRFFWRT